MRGWWVILAVGCGGDSGDPTDGGIPPGTPVDGTSIVRWDDTSIRCTDPEGAPTPIDGDLALAVQPGDGTVRLHACVVGAVEPCGFAAFDSRGWITNVVLFETASDRWSVTHTFTTNVAGTECVTESESVTMEAVGEMYVLDWRRSPQVTEPIACETTRTDVPEVDDTTPCILAHHVEAMR